MQSYFPDFEALNAYVQTEGKGFLLITYRNCTAYEGMVLGIMIVFDARMGTYELDLQWMSFGLDLYGDTLQESYVYAFESLQQLLSYLLEQYDIQVTDIPVRYTFDASQFPDPIKDAANKLNFEAGWAQFQQDFEEGLFLDPSQKLVYPAVEN